MPIDSVIVHHIKTEPGQISELNLREELQPLNDYSETLFAELKRSFLARITREHGTFNNEGSPSLLQFELDAYFANRSNYVEMTSALMERLKTRLEEQKVELNADISFFLEQSDEQQNFYIFVHRRNEMITLNPQMEIIRSEVVDTGASLFGIKVDLTEWKQHDNYVYLSMLPPKGDKRLLEIFNELTGFANGLNKAEDTQAFLQGVDAYSKTIPQEQATEFKNHVIDFCLSQDQRDEPVNYRELTSEIDGIDGDAFIKTMNDFRPEAGEELMMDRRKLQRYVKFAGRDKDLAISFSSFQLNHKVYYQAENDTLTITGLPSALRKQLKTHLEEE